MTSPSEQDIREKLNNELSVFAKYIRHHERTGLGGKNHQGVAADRILDLIIRYGNQRELEGRINSVQLYMDTCEEQGVDPDWPSIHEFQDGQKLAFAELKQQKEGKE